MEWNLKAPASEFEQAAISKIHAVQGDFSIDLKLGRVGNFAQEMVDEWKEPRAAKMAPLASGSSKRARAASNGTQTASSSCLVDRCNSDLSHCREYHRRHKVCEIHSKTPEVTIGGHKQRFCQQCSRFHSLEEFDEGKRSCRKRLDGHNRRRRKPQPEPMSRAGSFLSNYQGSQLMPFSKAQVYPSTTVLNPTWVGTDSTDEDARLYSQQQLFNLLDNQNTFLGSSSSRTDNKEGGKQFTALQGDNLTLNNQPPPRKSSICQPLLMSIALPESGVRNMFCNRLTNAVQYGDCALSLLSSPQSQTSGIRLSHLVHPNSTPLVQPLGPSLGDHRLEPMDSVLVSSGRDADDIHYPGPGNNVSQTLPFHWE